MSQATIYFPETNDGPTELTWGLPTNGQMLSHVEQWQKEIEREVQSRYKVEPAKNSTGRNDNMNKKRVER
tara:strand:- start:574 stop:783 length:210 start_codon:yes stop_codon:yes gene_type:complete